MVIFIDIVVSLLNMRKIAALKFRVPLIIIITKSRQEARSGNQFDT